MMSQDMSQWVPVRDGDDRARALYRRHYSCRHYLDGRNPAKIVGPGEYLMLLRSPRCDALFAWRRFIDSSGQRGVNCAIFRNEGPELSSTLIREAVALAWQRWPGERLYTYVNPKAIRSTNPGACFRKANWKRCGVSKGGLVILELREEQNASTVRI